VLPFRRRGAFPLGRCLALVLGGGLVLPLRRGRGATVGGCRVRASAGRLGVDVACQDDRVHGQSGGEGRDPSKSADDILASAESQAAVDHDPEELVVGPHGNLHHCQDDQPAKRSVLDAVETPA
jgi:hypothetical protein